jgi:hypothetical protein
MRSSPQSLGLTRGDVMQERLRSWWRQIKQHPYATGLVVVLVLILFIFSAYNFGWDWTGFNSGTNQITITNTSKGNYTATILQPSKSLWDWLGLFGVLAIPIVVGIGAVWFTAQQARASDAENTNSQRETVLQGYINKMSELLLGGYFDEPHPEYERARTVARARTFTLLPLLDGKRKTSLVRFLYESHLIKIIDLHGADLSYAELHEKDLSHINLSYADLSHTRLTRSRLHAANLSYARLTGAVVNSADLSEANLHDADLSYADLFGANLSEANLGKATITTEQLEEAYSLKGATMPDGSKHP